MMCLARAGKCGALGLRDPVARALSASRWARPTIPKPDPMVRSASRRVIPAILSIQKVKLIGAQQHLCVLRQRIAAATVKLKTEMLILGIRIEVHEQPTAET